MLDNQDPLQSLGDPILVLRVVEGVIKQNARVLISPEALYSIEVIPGSRMLISASSHSVQCKSFNKKSSFVPSSLELGLFKQYPPCAQSQTWNLDNQDMTQIGNFCLVCEVWPNSKLQKEEIQISCSLASDLRIKSTGNLIYLHLFDSKCSICQKLNLSPVEPKSLEDLNLRENGLGSRVWNLMVLSQLHNRVLLEGNLVSILVLGKTLLFKVTSLNKSADEEYSCLKIDADSTQLEIAMSTKIQSTDFLTLVQEAAGQKMEGSRKEAAESGALLAAKQGLSALTKLNHKELYIPEALSQSFNSLVSLPLKEPETFTTMGLDPPKGVILHGPPGSGKTLFACWAARRAQANFFVINGPSLVSEFYGGSESGLSGVFSAALFCAPSVIFIDEMDAILRSRFTGMKTDNSMYRMVTTLLTEFDALKTGVIVIAATNQIDSLDLALRRPGRFDREVEITTPSSETRLGLIQSHLKGIHHQLTEEQILEISNAAHGFLPADISALCQEASMLALRRIVKSPNSQETVVLFSDFKKARSLIRPNGLREFQVEVPCVHWEDIGGLESIKQQLKESIEWPIKHKTSLERLGVSTPKGVLLFGPPGCSKTLLAKAIATESGMNFISVKGSELLSAFVGQSEKSVSRLFHRGRLIAPCIIFLDEIDGLLGQRKDNDDLYRRLLSQVLTEMDGVQQRGEVVIIGATNIPQVLDPALLRPGRFDRLILVPPPDLQGREAIFKVHLNKMAISDDVNFKYLSEQTDSFSGADIAGLCWEAGIEALSEDINITCISMRHFLLVLQKAVPSLYQDVTLEDYKSFQRSVL